MAKLDLQVILRGLKTVLQTTLVGVGVGTGWHVPVALEEPLQNQLRQFHTVCTCSESGTK